MNSKRGLGRGLGALLGPEPDSVIDVTSEAPLEIPLDLVQPNPRQPRKRLDPGALDELTESIRAAGVKLRSTDLRFSRPLPAGG